MPRIAAIVPVTEAEGPGARLAVWAQGCAIRCPGCCNPQMFDPAGGRDAPIAEIAAEMDRVRHRIEGVTLLGGEPFAQPRAMAEVAREARRRGLSVVVFTGHTLEALRSGAVPDAEALLAETDLLVDGRYERDDPERRRRWVGSANQRFHFLTGRYRPGIEMARAGEPDRTVELRIGPDGRAHASGWPEW